MNNLLPTTPTLKTEKTAKFANGILPLYLIVIGLLAFQAIYTVYHGGLVVGNGYRLTQLEKQKAELSATKTSLTQELAQSHSLLQIQQSDVYKQFEPMSEVISVTDTQTVASR